MFPRIFQVSPSDNALMQVMAQVLIAVLVPVLTTLVGGLAAVCIQWVRSKMTAQQLAIADQIVMTYALAADQYDLGGVMKRSGEEKKAWVVEMAKAALAKRGIQIDVGFLADLVEAKVLETVKKARWMEPETILLTAGEAVKGQIAETVQQTE
jgi:hypothetical protein